MNATIGVQVVECPRQVRRDLAHGEKVVARNVVMQQRGRKRALAKVECEDEEEASIRVICRLPGQPSLLPRAALLRGVRLCISRNPSVLVIWRSA